MQGWLHVLVGHAHIQSLAVRAVQAYTLTEGGMLFFTDLTVPGPWWGLPMMCSISTAGMIYRGMNLDGSQMAASGQAATNKYLK